MNKRQQSLPHPMCLIWVWGGQGGGRGEQGSPPLNLTPSLLPTAHSNREGSAGDTRAGFQPGALLHPPSRGSGIAPRLTLAQHVVPGEPCSSPARYMRPIPWPPVPKSHPIYSAVTTSWHRHLLNKSLQGGISKLPAVQRISSIWEQDACALTAIPFSFCQQLVVELHSSINCSAALIQNPFSSGHW